MNNLSCGRQGEEQAQNYLIAAGFAIRHINWRWRHKELDIVAERDGILHIIEVKTRNANFLVSPSNSVTRRKQQHIIAAANAYIEKFSVEYSVQFDIIAVVIKNEGCKIEYTPCAFYPTL
ncbi:MAG: YraN family protein [Bacteroidales bacterium]